jgi:hypothetical protein
VTTLINSYRTERCPRDTVRSVRMRLGSVIISFPSFGDAPITDVQARPVELWLNSLQLSPKSRVQIQGLLSACGTLHDGAVTSLHSAIRWNSSGSKALANVLANRAV